MRPDVITRGVLDELPDSKNPSNLLAVSPHSRRGLRSTPWLASTVGSTLIVLRSNGIVYTTFIA